MRFNLSADLPRVKPVGSVGVRNGVLDRSAQNRSNWRFDAIPQEILGDVRRGWLSRIDPDVLGVILRYRGPRRDSAWVTKKKIADVLGVSPRTVQTSIKRLVELRWLDHRCVGRVDPDDPRNRTGWRFFFLWISEGLGVLSGEDIPPEELPGWAKARLGLANFERISPITAKTCESLPESGEAKSSPSTSKHLTRREKQISPPSGGGLEAAQPPDTRQKLLPPQGQFLLPTKEELRERKKETFNVPNFAKHPKPLESPKARDFNANANGLVSLSSSKTESPKTFCLTSHKANPDAVSCEEYDRAAEVLREVTQLGLPLHLNEKPDGPEIRYQKTARHIPDPDDYVRNLVLTHKRGLIYILRKHPRPLDAVQQAARDRMVAELEENQKRQQAMVEGRARILAGVDALARGPEAACDQLAQAMVTYFRERDPELSQRTFGGIARDVRNGKIPASTLKDAIIAACTFTGDCPGRVVVRRIGDAVQKRWDLRKPRSLGG